MTCWNTRDCTNAIHNPQVPNSPEENVDEKTIKGAPLQEGNPGLKQDVLWHFCH